MKIELCGGRVPDSNSCQDNVSKLRPRMEEINSPSETYVINSRRVGVFSKKSVVVESLNFGEPATFFQVAGIDRLGADRVT